VEIDGGLVIDSLSPKSIYGKQYNSKKYFIMFNKKIDRKSHNFPHHIRAEN
jgi:hypothetical protein